MKFTGRFSSTFCTFAFIILLACPYSTCFNKVKWCARQCLRQMGGPACKCNYTHFAGKRNFPSSSSSKLGGGGGGGGGVRREENGDAFEQNTFRSSRTRSSDTVNDVASSWDEPTQISLASQTEHYSEDLKNFLDGVMSDTKVISRLKKLLLEELRSKHAQRSSDVFDKDDFKQRRRRRSLLHTPVVS
ncbi:uncharacterized protein LOC141907500 [Tubulanus polymorphus]|uniref:uncharacterized protein LOC141907500 n=1 Tax=Tubulanus polymorphus TaxID=672921 RepID=UPI003DA509BA